MYLLMRLVLSVSSLAREDGCWSALIDDIVHGAVFNICPSRHALKLCQGLLLPGTSTDFLTAAQAFMSREDFPLSVRVRERGGVILN